MAADASLFRDILTPWQATWVAITAFPEHCDALGFLNAVAEQGEGSATGNRAASPSGPSA